MMTEFLFLKLSIQQLQLEMDYIKCLCDFPVSHGRCHPALTSSPRGATELRLSFSGPSAVWFLFAFDREDAAQICWLDAFPACWLQQHFFLLCFPSISLSRIIQNSYFGVGVIRLGSERWPPMLPWSLLSRTCGWMEIRA